MSFEFTSTTSKLNKLAFDTLSDARRREIDFQTLWKIPDVQRGASSDYVGSKQRFTPDSRPDFVLVFDAQVSGEVPEARTAYSRIGAYMHTLGRCSITLTSSKNRDASLSVFVDPGWRECYQDVVAFLVRHAFRELGLHRVSVTIFDGDDATAELYKKCGFTEEGRRRKANWVDGAWRDEILMGILEEEWAAQPTPVA